MAVTSVQVTDHAKNRIKELDRFDLDDYDHVHSVQALAEWVVDHADRCIDVSEPLRKWADWKRQEVKSDVFYWYQDRVFCFASNYRTFLKENKELVLVTVIYNPLDDDKQEYYYGENLIEKDLPDFDSVDNCLWTALDDFLERWLIW